MSLEDAPTPIEPRVFVRGNPNNLGEPVPRRFLAVLSGVERKPFVDGSGRLELARAIASPDNPLTARALVNRVWMHHLGTPLVATPGDFGMRSEPPTHPELLDHLAARFIENGWSIKALHRLIMRSSTYQQKSDDRPESRAIDPENALYWRMNRRRLDFEATRDALLAVSGRLDAKIGGPPMPSLTDTASNRRTLYGSIDRLNLPGLYRTFDFPDPNATSPKRDFTTVGARGALPHEPPVRDQRGTRDPESARDRRRAQHRCQDRAARAADPRPSAERSKTARWPAQFLGVRPDGSIPWQSFVQALLMANEFVFVD